MNFYNLKSINSLNILKKKFLQETFDSNLYYKNWNNSKFDGKIVETFEEYENPPVKYEINENGFRVDSKTNEIKKDKNVACFGCSNTYGTGLLFNETWPYALNQMLGDEWDVRNYGTTGASNDTISRLIHNYCLKNKPDHICVLFTEITRMELFDISKSDFYNFSPYKKKEEITSNIEFWKTYKAYKVLENEENGIYNFIKNFKFIDMICKKNNIPWSWTTWSLSIYFSSEDFKKDFLNIENFCELRDDYKSYYDFARDKRHFGKKMCNEIAMSFCNKILLPTHDYI